MVRSTLKVFVAIGVLVFAPVDAEAGKPHRHGSICNEAGLIGSAYGACNAYCEALDCDALEPDGSRRACENARNRFMKLTGELPPCEPQCPCGASWRAEGFVGDSVDFAECFTGGDETSTFSDLWVTDDVNGSVSVASFHIQDSPDGGGNAVGCFANLDPDNPESPLSGGFDMSNFFFPEPIRFDHMQKRIYAACEAEFAQLIEKLDVECVLLD